MSFSVAALHLAVAALFARRLPEHRAASWAGLLLALPAILAGGVAMTLAPEPATWPAAAQAVFVIGTAITVASLWTLGRSFALLPGVRAVVVRGPYRWVRHPAYLGELLMVAACAAAWGSVTAIVVALTVAAAVALRIGAEERLLVREQTYRDYAARVRWRLVPLLY